MGWTTPVNEATGYVVTATDWDNFLSGTAGNEAFLYGDAGWTNVASFTNSWTAVAGNTPRYMLIGRVVYLNGIVTGGTANTSAFTLGVGYRPSQVVHFTSSSSSAGTLVNNNVDTSGHVILDMNTTSNVNIILDCWFPAV